MERVDDRVVDLAIRLPKPLRPLARIAFNYRWAWAHDGPYVFKDIDPHRWELVGGNPIRLLMEADSDKLWAAASDRGFVSRVQAVWDDLDGYMAAPDPRADGRPIAFFCSEFGIHRSLPVYSGGLGVLAGDILKESSDRNLPVVGIGLLYRRGYFHQRVDLSGWQHEYWTVLDPAYHPALPVTGEDGNPLVLSVPLHGRKVYFQVWKVQVGRVPLYLLDSELQQNSPVDRFITGRLYEGNRALRLAQYGLLGVGGMRTLRALGLDPEILHLNEGHAALAAVELAAETLGDGRHLDEALDEARRRVVFTTHTPVPAGNETYEAGEFLSAYPDMPARLGIDPQQFLALARVNPHDPHERPGMTALAIRTSRAVNGVSARHGEVARKMWQPMFPDRSVEDVPISSVTNGVHLPTWMAPQIRRVLDRHLGEGWTDRAADPATWKRVDDIPDEELWAARCRAKEHFVDVARERAATDRLLRGEQIDYVDAAWETFDPEVLTIGFARRIATYKRLNVLTRDPGRVLSFLDGPHPVQFVFAGKAHPLDDAAKGVLQNLFQLKGGPHVPGRVAFLEDYDMSFARPLLAGSDVWVNVPRPPQEASGTSGMKAALNGALNLSVLDGWWAEGYDGTNGWAIEGGIDHDHHAQDDRHASALYDLIEHHVVPLFHDRDGHDVPVRWVQMIKASLRTLGPSFCATRMIEDYADRVYPGS